MPKCIFCKKDRALKKYYRCEITGQKRKYPCYDIHIGNYRPCKYFEMSLINRFLYWLGNKLS